MIKSLKSMIKAENKIDIPLMGSSYHLCHIHSSKDLWIAYWTGPQILSPWSFATFWSLLILVSGNKYTCDGLLNTNLTSFCRCLTHEIKMNVGNVSKCTYTEVFALNRHPSFNGQCLFVDINNPAAIFLVYPTYPPFDTVSTRFSFFHLTVHGTSKLASRPTPPQ